MSNSDNTYNAFKKLFMIVEKLRSPEGCPWDKKQTVETLLPHILEETYEAIDAVSNTDIENLTEEIGDLYLLVVMISYILEQDFNVSVSTTLNTISEKLVRRHPHVFGNEKVQNSEEVIKLWNDIKENVEKREKKNSILDHIPLSLPPLERAYLIQKKVSEVGFDWDNSHDVLKKITEELKEFTIELNRYSLSETKENNRDIKSEFGDLLFSLINAGRYFGIDPSAALHNTNQKFYKRFKYIEKELLNEGTTLEEATLPIMDKYWDEAKKNIIH